MCLIQHAKKCVNHYGAHNLKISQSYRYICLTLLCWNSYTDIWDLLWRTVLGLTDYWGSLRRVYKQAIYSRECLQHFGLSCTIVQKKRYILVFRDKVTVLLALSTCPVRGLSHIRFHFRWGYWIPPTEAIFQLRMARSRSTTTTSSLPPKNGYVDVYSCYRDSTLLADEFPVFKWYSLTFYCTAIILCFCRIITPAYERCAVFPAALLISSAVERFCLRYKIRNPSHRERWSPAVSAYSMHTDWTPCRFGFPFSSTTPVLPSNTGPVDSPAAVTHPDQNGRVFRHKENARQVLVSSFGVIRIHHTLSSQGVRTSSFPYNHHICRTLAFPRRSGFHSVKQSVYLVFPTSLSSIHH